LAQVVIARSYPQIQPRRAIRPCRRFPYRIISWAAVALIGVALLGIGRIGLARESNAAFDAMIARHARANEIPESLIRRVIWRESKYNPGLVGRGNAMGLMQIKPATAREVGYQGSASELLDAETNMTYATRYLAGAYRVAGGNADRAVALYAKGYYFEAKRRGMLAMMERYRRTPEQPVVRESSTEENPARHAASFQLASAEPFISDAPARLVPGARTVATETIRKEALAPEPKKPRELAAAAREPVRVAAVVPAVPLPREKPMRVVAALREVATVREVAAVRYSIPAREPVSARQLVAAREAAAIAPDSFATGDLFVPHATPVVAEAAPRYTTASVRTLSDAPTAPRVLDQYKVAAVEAPLAAEPAPAPQPERVEAVARPASEPQPIAESQPLPVAQPQANIAPQPAAPFLIPAQPKTPAATAPSKPGQQDRSAAQRKSEEAPPAKPKGESNRARGHARVQQNAAPAPLRWLEQQFASLGRALSGPQQRQPRRAPAQ
jgi:soluble lytic murein transglycosylase-like protein